MRILIVDDHAVVRTGVRQILADEFPGTAFAEAADARQAIAATLNTSCDLAIVDIAMPGRGGLDLLKDLKALHPGLPVLVFSMYAEQEYAVRALRSGAAGYLAKASLSDELVAAARKALAGGRYVSTELAERLASELGAPAMARQPHDALSDRELEVLRRLGAGKAVKEIAAALDLSPNTVSTYRKRILEKMGMRSNAELVRYAVERGLIE